MRLAAALPARSAPALRRRRLLPAALLLLAAGRAAASIDVVEQLYKLRTETNASQDDDSRIVLNNAPDLLVQRLEASGLAWDELSGSLQRALLWDLGLVLTDQSKLVQVLVPCGESMNAVFLSRSSLEAVPCPTQPDCSARAATTNCSFSGLSSIAQCAVRDGISAIEPASAAIVWSEDGALASVPDIRVYKSQVNASAGSSNSSATSSSPLIIISQAPMDLLSANDCPTTPLFVMPCIELTSDAGDWCEPLGNSFIDLWIEKEMPVTEQSTGLSTGTIALITIAAVLTVFFCSMLGAYTYLSQCRSKRWTRRALYNSADTPTASRGVESRDSLSILEQEFKAPSKSITSRVALLTDATASAGAVRLSDTDHVSEAVLRHSVELQPICTDAQIMARRVPFDSLKFSRLIARGANGEVWQGEFRGRVVAIKSLLPEKRHDKAAVQTFAHEIRIASALVHPNIVRFLGLSWRQLSELCVVSEFMDGGDLSELLSSERSKQLSWSNDKLSIATDIAEALAYLHSRSPVIIHRDLKSLNVLLNARLRAKLSDFGLSRERSMEETMTSGVGTLLWTAPEILRGEPYSEKADVYSYGIVLSELDTCLPPFSLNDEVSRQRLTTMQLIHLVTCSKLAPEFRSDCPSAIAKLALSCAAPDASDRPSALQIVFTLRNISGVIRFG